MDKTLILKTMIPSLLKVMKNLVNVVEEKYDVDVLFLPSDRKIPGLNSFKRILSGRDWEVAQHLENYVAPDDPLRASTGSRMQLYLVQSQEIQLECENFLLLMSWYTINQ